MAASRTYVALLRGINLGACRRVQMTVLRALLEERGHGDVATYLQSGNVVLRSGLGAAALETRLERELADGLGFDVDVLVRTGAELRAIVKRNPLAEIARDPTRYLVTFLRAKPDKALAARLAALEPAPEQVVAAGRELYSWHPGGIGRSPLAKQLLPKALGGSASARNWRVVEHLCELARGG